MAALTMAESLALFDQAAQLRQEEAPPPTAPADLALAFQAASAAQGLPVTTEFAARVVARVQADPGPPAVVPWARPTTAQAWLAEVKELKRARVHRKRHEARVDRGLKLGSLGVGVVSAACIAVQQDGVTPAWVIGLLGTAIGAFIGLVTWVISLLLWVIHVQDDDEKPTRRLQRLQEATLSEAQVKAYAEVPGLATQLGAVIQTSVPLLTLDVEAAEAALQAHQRQAQAQQAATEAKRKHAEDQAAKAWLRAQVPEGATT